MWGHGQTFSISPTAAYARVVNYRGGKRTIYTSPNIAHPNTPRLKSPTVAPHFRRSFEQFCCANGIHNNRTPLLRIFSLYKILEHDPKQYISDFALSLCSRVFHAMNTQTGLREERSIHMFAPANNESNGAYISATGTGLEILGRRAKELICSIQKLRQLGIENLGLPLPKIALIGDQSTGKSSLIEGIR